MSRFIILLSLFSLVVASCQTGCNLANSSEETADQTIHLFVWGEYTSKEIFDDFFKRTGIHVIETNFSSNEEMLAKIQTGVDGYDLIIPSDYMVRVMSQLNLLTPIDKSKIPNSKNIESSLLGLPFDPANTWSLPYAWSVAGVIYNAEKVSNPITSYREFFSRGDLRYRFSILDDSREMIGSALISQGFSANTTAVDKLNQLKATLVNIKKSAREFNSSPTSQLLHGDLVAAQIYSNEALRIADKHPQFKFILPEDGFTMAIDNMAIPKLSKKSDLSYKLMDYLLDPAVNRKFATSVLAPPVVRGVHAALPESMKTSPAMGPLHQVTKRAQMIHELGDVTKKYDRIWTELKATEI